MQPALSFIVIARNQRGTICRALASARRAAFEAGLEQSAFEMIYVDSKSTDGSISAVREAFGDAVLIVRLSGHCNAAIARNVGASVSSGGILFFVDGDMEIAPAFLKETLSSDGGLIHPVVAGQLPEKVYDENGLMIRDAPDRYGIRSRAFRAELGGVFLIDRATFQRVEGFADELRCNEDIDLGLRLARSGTLTLGIPAPIALHHTIDYLDWGRMRRMTMDGSLLYPGMLFRRHVANRHYWPILMSTQRSTGVMLVSIALAFIADPAFLMLLFGYLILKNVRRRHLSLAQDIVGTTARSLGFLVGLFVPLRKISKEAISFERV